MDKMKAKTQHCSMFVLRGVMLFNSRLNKQHLKFYPTIH